MGLRPCHRCLHGNHRHACFCATCGQRLPATVRWVAAGDPPSHTPVLSLVSLTLFACLLLRTPTSQARALEPGPTCHAHGLIYDMPAHFPASGCSVPRENVR